MNCPKCDHLCHIDRVPSDIPGWTVKVWLCGNCGWSEDDLAGEPCRFCGASIKPIPGVPWPGKWEDEKGAVHCGPYETEHRPRGQGD